jgi:hypothetical protein
VKAPFTHYIRFNDEFEDVLASVELVALVAPRLCDNPSLWKWMIVGAQSALQGAMVCALVEDASVLKPANPENKKAAQEAAELDIPQQLIEDHLEEFDVLLKRCIRGNDFCEPLVLTTKQRENISKLHSEFRNRFIHFTPKGWSIEKAYLSPMICTALDAMEALMSRDVVINRFDARDRQVRLTTALQTVRDALGS